MSTVSITRRPLPVATASAATGAVLAFAGLTLVQHDSGSPAPGTTPQHHTQARDHGGFHPTTSGGRVQLGLT